MEVYTDKLVAKIPSTCTGVVKSVKFEVDDVCLVGHALLEIEAEGEGSVEPMKKEEPVKKEAAKQENKPQAAIITNGPGKYNQIIENNLDTKTLSTPAVRHFVKNNGLDIN